MSASEAQEPYTLGDAEAAIKKVSPTRSTITVDQYSALRNLSPDGKRLAVARMAQQAEKNDVSPLVGTLGKIGAALVGLAAAGELVANRLSDITDGTFWVVLAVAIAVSLALAVVSQISQRRAKALFIRVEFFKEELRQIDTGADHPTAAATAPPASGPTAAPPPPDPSPV